MAVLSGLHPGRVLSADAHVASVFISSPGHIVTRIAHVAVVAALVGPATVAAQNPKTQPRTHTPEPTTAAITAADLKTRLYIFAADSMEGRETGTRGHIKATNYIEAELK